MYSKEKDQSEIPNAASSNLNISELLFTKNQAYQLFKVLQQKAEQ